MTAKDHAKTLSVMAINRSYEYRGVSIYKDAVTRQTTSSLKGPYEVTVARYTAYIGNGTQIATAGTATSILREVDRALRGVNE